MPSLTSLMPRLAACFALGVLAGFPALAQQAEPRLAETVREVEETLGARVGVQIRDSRSDWRWGHREDERFPMNSTVKSVLCGAVLDRVEEGGLDLDETLAISGDDILDHAPVTESRAGTTMAVGELCLAALDMSDNTATNLLIDRLGGPGEVTAFLRDIGDTVSRLDRREPELNAFAPDDPRDTTTPAAMLTAWQAMLLDDALAPASRALLVGWMSYGGVTGGLIRASTPDGWRVADKSGAGDRTRSIVAMVTPPGRPPHLVAIYLSGADADFDVRDDAVARIAAAAVDVIASR